MSHRAPERSARGPRRLETAGDRDDVLVFRIVCATYRADPAALDTELARIRTEYNTVRLHASIGYVTPDDEHHGRGPRIRRARVAGMRRAQAERIKQNRASKK